MSKPQAVFSDDITSLNINGNRFVAVDADPGRCTGTPRCIFAVGFECDLWARSGGIPHCQPRHRPDGRSIVWVKPTREV